MADGSANVAALLDTLRAIGLVESEVQAVGSAASKNSDMAPTDLWLAIASQLRPKHVFDATYYHCAESVYRFILQFFPTPHVYWGNRGVLMQEWGRFSEAIDFHSRALAQKSDYARAHANLGFCYEQAGLSEKALEHHNFYEKLEGPDSQSRTGIGNCFRELRQIDRAIACYEEALELDARHGDARFMLSVALATTDKWDSALANIEQLLKQAPSDEGALSAARQIRARIVPNVGAAPRRPFDRLSRQMSAMAAYPTSVNAQGPWGWVVEGLTACSFSPPSPNKVFISYRWDKGPEDAWVESFARKLIQRGYRVVLDRFAPASDFATSESYPSIVRQLANTSIFVPILTNRYRRRVEMVGDLQSDTRTAVLLDAGRVFDEWSIALVLAVLGRIKLFGVWRSDPVVPVPFTPETVCDLRTGGEGRLERAFPMIGDGRSREVSAGYDELRIHNELSNRLRKLPPGWPADSAEAFMRLRVPDLQNRIVTTA